MTRVARPLSPILDQPAQPGTPSPSPRKVYDRSSFEGDFVVTIPDQTAEDFERFAPETQFCEYFDGTIYMPSPVADRHQEIVIFLTSLLDGFRWERYPALQLLTGPAVLRLAGESKPEPDLFVRLLDRPDAKAALVVEVVSPSHRAYDLEFKASKYQEAGLPEIWYIDDAARSVCRDRPDGAGYVRETLGEGRLAALEIPGFWVDVAWFWADPLPNPRECLRAILAAPPA